MPRRALVMLAAASLLASGCTSVRNAAQQDPMKCERDPKCDQKRGRTMDCSLQCSDEPNCVERCEGSQAVQKLGH